MPLTPAPETAWKLVAITRVSRPASCSGLSGITVTIVVQFGHARMPWCRRAAWALISGTTSGTSGSNRNAFDLSITVAPALTIIGAYSFDCADPAAQKAISTPLNAAGSIRRIVIGSPRKVTVLPTERSEANARSSRTGNLRSSRMRSVVCPAAPVAPTTAMQSPDAISTAAPARARSGLPSPASRSAGPPAPRCPPCGALARAPGAPRARPGRRPSPCSANTVTASPRKGSPRSGSRCPCRRCRARCREPARRARPIRRARPRAACPSIRRESRPHRTKYHRRCSRSQSCRTAWAGARAPSRSCRPGRARASRPGTRGRPASPPRARAVRRPGRSPCPPRAAACGARQSSRVPGASGLPVASIAAPPTSPRSNSNAVPVPLPTASSTRMASGVTSAPMPSPGRTAIRYVAITWPPRFSAAPRLRADFLHALGRRPSDPVQGAEVRARARLHDVRRGDLARDHRAVEVDLHPDLADCVLARRGGPQRVVLEPALEAGDGVDRRQHRVDRPVADARILERLPFLLQAHRRRRHHPCAADDVEIVELVERCHALGGLVGDDRHQVLVVDLLLAIGEVLECLEGPVELRAGQREAELLEP